MVFEVYYLVLVFLLFHWFFVFVLDQFGGSLSETHAQKICKVMDKAVEVILNYNNHEICLFA